MDRCVVVPDDRTSLPPTCRCEIANESHGDLVQDWWLLISQSKGCEPSLTVIQPLSALPNNSGLTGLLTARITFRLHVLQRRGEFLGEIDRGRIVQRVNQQIQQVMKSLPY